VVHVAGGGGLVAATEVMVTHTRHVRVVASRPSGIPCVPVTKASASAEMTLATGAPGQQVTDQ
jgi:hypothetical protein